MRKCWYLEKPIAHRGLHRDREVPENSLLSFERAIEKKYPIELDIHLTKDHQVVVFHDKDTKRLTGKNLVIEASTLSELQVLRLYETNERIPTLQEVLELVQGKVPLVIEIKSSHRDGVFEDICYQQLKFYKGEFSVQSFNPHTLRWFKQNVPYFIRGLLSSRLEQEKTLSYPEKWLLKNLALTPWLEPHYIGYDWKALDQKVLKAVRAIGIPILAWTIKDQSQADQVQSLCDNIIFENFSP